MTEVSLYKKNKNVLFWMQAGLLAVVFFVVFREAFLFILNTWITRDNYSYGFLVPLVSLLIIYVDREKLRTLPIKPNLLGGGFVLLCGGMVFIMGRISGGVIAQELSVLIVIPGLVLILLGAAFVMRLAFPLSYLVLTVPVFDFGIEHIQYTFQLISAAASGILLQAMTVAVTQHNQFLVLPNITLEVAPECSGLHYMMVIFATALPLSLYTLTSWRRRLGLLVIAFLIGISANILRITLIGIWSVVSGGGPVHGPFHVLQGMFVSIIGFAGIFLAAFALARSAHSESEKEADVAVLAPASLNHDLKKMRQGWLIAVLIFCCIGMYGVWYTPHPIPLKKALKELPLVVEEWRGTEMRIVEAPFGLQHADSELLRTYRSSQGGMIQLYIGYFESQNKDKKVIHHLSKINSADGERFLIPIEKQGSIETIKMLLQDGQRTYALFAFYYANGRPIVNRYEAKLLFGLHGLIYQRTNGAVVVVSREVTPGAEVEAVFAEEARFLEEMYPFIRKVLS